MVATVDAPAQALFSRYKKPPIKLSWGQFKNQIFEHSTGSYIYYQQRFFQAIFTFCSSQESLPEVLLIDVTQQLDLQLKDAIANSTRLANALDQQQIVLFSQPIAPLKRQHDIDELVCRIHDTAAWPQPLPPNALSNRLVVNRLAHWCLGYALQMSTTTRWSVNVPIGSIDSDLLTLVQGGLDSGPLKPEQLVIEVAYSAAASSPSLSCIYQLRQLGVQIALQDVGTVPWTAEHLNACDVVKVAGSLTQHLRTCPAKQRTLAAIVSHAHASGIEVCAQSIENGFDLDDVRAAGCDYAQGYYLGQPRRVQTAHKPRTQI